MLIDFTKLHDLIPEGGCVAFTVKRNKDGKLGVVFKTTHNLAKAEGGYTNDKDVKGDLEGVEKAKKALDKTVGFCGTPENLTLTFEEQIKAPVAAERMLADAINERTKELNERIAALKNKKVAPKTTTIAKSEAKKEEPKTPPEKTKEADLGLFSGSVGASAPAADPSCSTGSCEGPEEGEEEGAEEGELVGEVTA